MTTPYAYTSVTAHALELDQAPANPNFSLYVAALDAHMLSGMVSIKNPVKWDATSSAWVAKGRNRTLIPKHARELREFLGGSSVQRLLPSALVISVDGTRMTFQAGAATQVLHGARPGVLEFQVPTRPAGGLVPEEDRIAWVLDGQHRIDAFRAGTLPQPFPVNVVVIRQWQGPDYEDTMRQQTYELNLGRPLSEDLKASLREQYSGLVGNDAYKEQIALSWIRVRLENRRPVFAPGVITGATKIRTPYVIAMSLLESIIALAYKSDAYLATTYPLKTLTTAQADAVSEYLYTFYEGVRRSIGIVAPQEQVGFLGLTPPVVAGSALTPLPPTGPMTYWDVAVHRPKPNQRLLHNVGLKAVTRALLHAVMRTAPYPNSPDAVAKRLHHVRGIPWGSSPLTGMKDDWVLPLSEALKMMYADPLGTGKPPMAGTPYVPAQYTLNPTKPGGASYSIVANGF